MLVMYLHTFRYGWARLSEFERLFNREMWWVILHCIFTFSHSDVKGIIHMQIIFYRWVGSEVCAEKNVGKRAKLIKKFIKVAR